MKNIKKTRNICKSCLKEDKGLADFIEFHGTLGMSCDYCPLEDERRIMTLETLSKHVVECLKEFHDIVGSVTEGSPLYEFLTDYFPPKNKNIPDDMTNHIKNEYGISFLKDRQNWLPRTTFRNMSKTNHVFSSQRGSIS